jgi:nucleoside-diphosphate-sugar epimerase
LAHILVVGLGDLGQSLALRWLADGHQISAIRRSASPLPGIALFSQDLLRDAVVLPESQVDLVVIILTPASRDETGYQGAYLVAPERLLDALAQQQPLPPVVFVSSTAVYGEHSGEPDEETAPRPDGFNGRILLAAEQALSLRTLVTAVRFSGIYGPGRERLQRMVQGIRQGASPPLPQWSNRIHRDDCVGLLKCIGDGWLRGEMQPAVVVGTDNEPAVNVAVLNWISARSGEPLALPEPDIAPGKRVRSRYLREGHYTLQYPDYQSGYASLL